MGGIVGAKTPAITTFLAVLALAFSAAPAVAAEDTTGPQLLSAHHVGKTVVAGPDDRPEIAVTAEDPSGISHVSATIDREGGWHGTDPCGTTEFGSNYDDPEVWIIAPCGWYENVAPSDITVTRLELSDWAGNTTTITDPVILEPLAYRVENADYDGVAPVLESVSVHPRVALPGEDITVTMRIRETAPYLSASYRLTRPLAIGGDLANAPVLSDEAANRTLARNGDGTYTVVDTYISGNATEYGDYPLGRLELNDGRGNWATVDPGESVRIDDPLHPVGATEIRGDAMVDGTLQLYAPWATPELKPIYGWGMYSDFAAGTSTRQLQPVDAYDRWTGQVTATWPDKTVRSRMAQSEVVRKGTLGVGAVSIQGTPAVDRTLTARHRQIHASKSPYYWYTWLRDGVQIPEGLRQAYTPTVADRGHRLSVRVTSNAGGYFSETTTSPMVLVAAGTLAAPVPTTRGEAGVGSVHTATAGTWTSGTTLKYQWLRNGSTISGATARTYTAVKADLNQVLQVRVTGTKPGYATVARTSAAKRPVTGKLATSAPRLEGTSRVGVRLRSALPTSWTAGTVLRYQWQRNARNISGATASSYTPTATDRGQQVRVRVSGSKTGYTAATRYSAATRPGYGVLANTPPGVTGTAAVGRKLTASPGTWTRGTILNYQWLRDGNRITGATKRSYTVRTVDRRKILSVMVTGSKPGYRTVRNESGVKRVK